VSVNGVESRPPESSERIWLVSNQFLIDAYAAGVYSLFGVMQFDLWRRHRTDRGPLWIAIAAAGALMVNLSSVASQTGISVSMRGLLVLNHLGVAIATAALYEFAAGLEGRPAGRPSRLLEVAVFATAIVAVFVPPLFVAILVTAGLLLISASIRALRSAMAEVIGGRTFLYCFLVLLACLLLDLIRESGVTAIPASLPVVGFIVLFLGAAKAMLDRRQHEAEELAELRHNLELRIEERTAQLTEANQQLEEMARSDWLTGLPNRRGFLAAAEAEERRSRRSGHSFSVALGDLDHFKRVNDEHGHATGDAVLQAVATAVRGALREQDLVARWGGEELILLLPETGLAGAVAAAGAVREAVSAVQVAAADKRLAPLTISVGVAEHRPDRSLEATIAAADRALYRAKAEGRDRVTAD